MNPATHRVCTGILNPDHSISEKPNEKRENIDDDKPLIAVVDDNGDVRILLETILEEEYRVKAFATVSSLLEFLKDTRCDLIISDLGMPFQNGFALIETLKQDSRLSTIPVAAFTADSSMETRKRVLAAGFCSYLVKPADLEALPKIAHLLIPAMRTPADDQTVKRAVDC